MPITTELDNVKKLESVGFTHEQAEVMAEIHETTAKHTCIFFFYTVSIVHKNHFFFVKIPASSLAVGCLHECQAHLQRVGNIYRKIVPHYIIENSF